MPVVDGTGRAPWKTGQNHVLGTYTYTDPYTDPRTGTHEKVADARRGRNWTRAMDNWAKPRTRHTHVHRPLHGPVNGLYGYTGKKWPTPVLDGTGRAPWKTGQNHVRDRYSYTDL